MTVQFSINMAKQRRASLLLLSAFLFPLLLSQLNFPTSFLKTLPDFTPQTSSTFIWLTLPTVRGLPPAPPELLLCFPYLWYLNNKWKTTLPVLGTGMLSAFFSLSPPPQAKQWVQATSRLGEPRVSFARGNSGGQRIHWSQVKDERSTVVRGSFCIAIIAPDPCQWRWLGSRTLLCQRSRGCSHLGLHEECALVHAAVLGLPPPPLGNSHRARAKVTEGKRCCLCWLQPPWAWLPRRDSWTASTDGKEKLPWGQAAAGLVWCSPHSLPPEKVEEGSGKPGSWRGTERPFTASPYLYYNSTSSPFSAWAVWKWQHYPGRSHPAWERSIEQLYHHARCKAEPSASLGPPQQLNREKRKAFLLPTALRASAPSEDQPFLIISLLFFGYLFYHSVTHEPPRTPAMYDAGWSHG